MKRLLQFTLKVLARLTLARYRPQVVGITGSVGKTGTRAAVALALSTRFRVGGSAKNLNNEIGLPLAVLGEPDSGYRSLHAWFSIFFRALWQLIRRNSTYPEVLVLEYGVDHPGDMAYLLSIARPTVAVVTAVAPTHLEFMGSVEQVAREKGKLVQALPPGGLAVLNVDFPLVAAMGSRTQARMCRYGFGAQAEVRALGMGVSQHNSVTVGMSFRLFVGGSTIPMQVTGAVGEPPVYMVLAAAAVAHGLGLSTLQVTEALKHFSPPLGRLRLLPGLSGTTVLDDTYNSSPVALTAALSALCSLPLGGRRWAVLGDMLELGRESETLHREAGRQVVAAGIDFLVTVGEASRAIAQGAAEHGLATERVAHYQNSEAAGEYVRQRLQVGDVVLVKGSQGVRCERVVRQLMAEPERAREFLVRQDPPWV